MIFVFVFVWTSFIQFVSAFIIFLLLLYSLYNTKIMILLPGSWLCTKLATCYNYWIMRARRVLDAWLQSGGPGGQLSRRQ